MQLLIGGYETFLRKILRIISVAQYFNGNAVNHILIFINKERV
jgi:hypothetical protein